MEEDEAAKIWQRDVNNYLMVNSKGEVKRKGAWLIDSYEKPGYVMVGALSAFVSAKAVTDYLLNGTDIVKSVVANKNVKDFVMTCKKGPSYSRVVQKFADDITDLAKRNKILKNRKDVGFKASVAKSRSGSGPKKLFLQLCIYDKNHIDEKLTKRVLKSINGGRGGRSEIALFAHFTFNVK
jgi:hypothetical protein